MRLALLAGASPRSSKGGPVSRLPAGNYSIHIDGMIDSIMQVLVDGIARDLAHGHSLELARAANVQALFVTRGTESYINVIAVRAA